MLPQSKGMKEIIKKLQKIIEEKRKKRDGKDDEIGKLTNITVHSNDGCIIFLNSDIDN